MLAWTPLCIYGYICSGLKYLFLSLSLLSQSWYQSIGRMARLNIQMFWTHLVIAYAITFWTCYLLRKEYDIVATMRLHFLATEQRRPDQFTVLVRNVPPDPHESVSEHVEHFFLVNHPDYYLTHQVVCNANKLAELVKKKKKMQNWLDYYELKYSRNPSRRPTTKIGFLGLTGDTVDSIAFYSSEIEKVTIQIKAEEVRIKKDTRSVMPAAFVSFKTRWAAAVCAQTQQFRNPTLWLTEWAPEPRDIYWDNLAIPFVSLSIRKLVVAVAFFFLTFFFMIPIAFVQSLANIEGIEKAVPFLRPVIEVHFIKSFIQGLISLSALERTSAARYYIFLLVNVFLGSIITGTAFQQLNSFIHQSASDIPKTIGVSIPMKATFFITYIMVDGWAGIAVEIVRLRPLIIYHSKNFFLVKTDKDQEEAMDPGSLGFNTGEPRIQLYFLLGLVYAAVTPIVLPFILAFFCLAYIVFRHQIINVYNQEYESAAAFWPDVHRRIITALIISQLLLMGLLSTKKAEKSTPILVALPVLTLFFHKYCKTRFEPAFSKYPLQEVMMKDTLERTREPNLNLKDYLRNAYIHPVFKGGVDDESLAVMEEWEQVSLVATKRQSRKNTPQHSNYSGSSASLLLSKPFP
ncbi:hypothetical protein Scep_028819 [Stephania cephalantha]|uniref:Uncharacterized protein n=1 Tax=Stephania cephalantha TaxID=152367 RepID=A0AAP0EDT8_9MAGN